MTEPCRFESHLSSVRCVVHDSAPLLWTICATSLAALRAELERVKKEYVDTSRALRKADDGEMAVGCLERENGELRDQLEAITAWSPVSARPCPLCTYQDGKFLAPCAWHREVEAQARVIAGLREALRKATGLLDEAKAQWGEDYLWKKWGMDDVIAEVKALSPTKEA